MGYRDDKLFLKEEFEPWANVAVATEDGSVGTKGNVLDAIRGQGLKGEIVYACGPTPMLRALKGYGEEMKIPCWISLEAVSYTHLGIGDSLKQEICPALYTFFIKEGMDNPLRKTYNEFD